MIRSFELGSQSSCFNSLDAHRIAITVADVRSVLPYCFEVPINREILPSRPPGAVWPETLPKKNSVMKQLLLRQIRRHRTLHQTLMKLRAHWKTIRHGQRSDQEVFSSIYESRYWGDGESGSGHGSSVTQTNKLIEVLPGMWRSLGVKTVLDLPCGDFNWMQRLDLSGFNYIGGDLVESVIESNRRKYETDHIKFQCLNLVTDSLPNADLVFVRDCLVHLTYEQIQNALDNICRSNIKYLMTTTFIEHNWNIDIITGQWRPLNLQREPFSLPNPDELVVEGSTVGGDEFADKAMAVWKVSDLIAHFESSAKAHR